MFLGTILFSIIAFGIYNINSIKAEEEVEQECVLPLFKKDSEWNIVGEGGYGEMWYNFESLEVGAMGLNPNTEYTLIEYPEPQTDWPWPVVEIVSGVTNNNGSLNWTAADYSISAGEKYWFLITVV